MLTDPKSLLRQARWCRQKLRDCTDRDLAFELRCMVKSLVRQARDRLMLARTARRSRLAAAA